MSIKSTLRLALQRGVKRLSGATRRPPKETIAISDARPQIAYAPARDGGADPGEVVWTWVPYQEDATRGKDRPVLIIGRISDDLAGLMLTTKEHNDSDHVSIGTGSWDPASRPSWVRLDRVLRLESDQIRREGAALDRTRFDQVVRVFERGHGGR